MKQSQDANAGSFHADGSTPTDDVVRKMRDRVYGHPISDKEWESVGTHWNKPEEIEWLRAQLEKASNGQALRSAPTADVERKKESGI